MYDIEKVNGRYFDFYLPENPTCCMTCMFTTMTCFMCCGYGPLAMEPKSHRKEGTDEWIGGGQVCAGGCCPCMDNQGDFMIINDAHDGSTPEKYAVLIAGTG